MRQLLCQYINILSRNILHVHVEFGELCVVAVVTCSIGPHTRGTRGKEREKEKNTERDNRKVYRAIQNESNTGCDINRHWMPGIAISYIILYLVHSTLPVHHQRRRVDIAKKKLLTSFSSSCVELIVVSHWLQWKIIKFNTIAQFSVNHFQNSYRYRSS